MTAPDRDRVVEPGGTLSVVAVTYSPGSSLDGFLDCLPQATAEPSRCVLADNGSSTVPRRRRPNGPRCG